MSETTALEVQSERAEYSLIKPKDITNFSKVLKEYITQSGLSTKIRGDQYVNVDGWKFAGLNFGLIPVVGEPIALHQKGELMVILYHEVEKRTQYGKKMEIEPFFSSSNFALAEEYRTKFKDRIKKEVVHDFYNYKCGCDIINAVTGAKMGAGWGLCNNVELSKTSYDEFSVHSMAQTRAIGRAFKNVIGFIMKSAGYVPTPSEEMDGVKQTVVYEDSAAIDIKVALEGCSTTAEVMQIWNQLDSVTQNRYKQLFTKRKTELTKK